MSGLLKLTVKNMVWLLAVACFFVPATDVPAEETIPPGPKVYMGRTIANTMHWKGADWLTRKERELEESAALMIKQLELKEGQVVADLGCGNGYHTLTMAKLVGETGVVWGSDIQPEMLKMLEKRAADAGVKNIKSVQGTLVDPKLPKGKLDLILMVDVYHEFSHPEQMLKKIRASLKPGGQVVFLEYREEDKTVPIRALHKMSKAQLNKEVLANGFTLVKEFDELPWQHMMFYSPDPAFKAE